MVSSDNAPVTHLIIDSAGFIKRAPILSIGKITYTLVDVIDEIRDKSTKEYIKNSPFELVFQSPTLESLKIVTEIAKKTGDYPSLSKNDLKIIALVHDLHVQHCGKNTINYDISVKVSEVFERSSSPTLEKEIGFFSSDKKDSLDEDKNHSITEDHTETVDDDENDSEWISQDNFDDALLKYNAGTVRPEIDENGSGRIEVACLTTDFSIQNVLVHMKMNIISLDGLLIKHLNSYVLRCRSCFDITTIMTKEFCRRCGYATLERVAVSVGNNGKMRLHIDPQRLRITRGFRHSIVMPKGGKHHIPEKLFEDQRIPQNRMAKVKNSINSEASPFTLNDVFSRSALLGIRSLNNTSRSKRNPNESAGGKRKKK